MPEESIIQASMINEGDTVEVWLEDEVMPEGGWWWRADCKRYKGQLCLLQVEFDYKDREDEIVLVNQFEGEIIRRV